MSSPFPERGVTRRVAVRVAARVAVPLMAAVAMAGCREKADAAVTGDPGTVSVKVLGRASGIVATNLPADDGQWTIASKDYANTRYSALGQINAGNASQLRLAWSWSTGIRKGHEGAPLIVDGTMFVVTPFPNQLVALDLANHGAVKWKYRPPYLASAPGVSCCGHINRGPAYADGRVFYATLDNQVIAVDAASGKEAWRVRVGEIQRGETMTMAPIVVKGKVIVGNSGGEFGVRGWVTALDAATGAIAWRAYHTGPDKDVLIGPGFTPFYAKDRGTDLGEKSWQPLGWQNGGASMWGWFSYDPELNLLYYGTGNAGPWNPDLRPGDNKWAATLFARDPETGQAKWAYQIAPHDKQDYDAVNESMLLDLPINGQPRRTLLRAERNGYFYVMDRVTGEILSADPYVFVNAVKSVDTKTGYPKEDPEKSIRTGVVVRHICPSVPGGKDWEPMAYSFRTGLVYIPAINQCMDVEGVEASYIEGTPYLGTITKMYAGPGGKRGALIAWDPVQRKKVWEVPENFPVYAGALATAGDVVFYATQDRWFRALDARSGKLLWQFRLGSGSIGQPVTWRGADGKQFVAIFDGVGGWPGSTVTNDANPLDSAASDGFVGATGDLVKYTEKGGTLYVFALP